MRLERTFLAAVTAATVGLSASPALAAPLSTSRAKAAILSAEARYWHRDGGGKHVKLSIRDCRRLSPLSVSCRVQVAGALPEGDRLLISDTAIQRGSRILVRFGYATLD
jgi:hypothetical protein